MEKTQKQDLLRGFTQIGPHRDDFSMYFDSYPIKNYASEGQKRMILLALRLSEKAYLYEKTQDSILLHIDDLDIHLDQSHQRMLRETLSSLEQIFVTTPVETIDIPYKKQLFIVKEGNVLIKH